MNIFAHAGHEHEVSHAAVNTGMSDGVKFAIMAAVGLVLVTVIVVGTIYTQKQKSQKSAKKTSQK